MHARVLLGSAVHDRRGRDLGTVEQIVVDRLTGRVSFAVVGLVGRDSSPTAFLPVPWAALKTNADNSDLSVEISAQRIAGAPTIEPEDLDDLERRDIGVEVFTYYGLQPPWERGPEDRCVPRGEDKAVT